MEVLMWDFWRGAGNGTQVRYFIVRMKEIRRDDSNGTQVRYFTEKSRFTETNGT